MSARPLKIGLDLDGVILYNPARTVRPFITFFKRVILGKKEVKFSIPRKPWEKYIWHLLHKSSIFVAPGFAEIKQLAKEKKVELYIITGRYSFLIKDLEKWLKKIEAESFVKKWYYNKYDEQNHFYKEKLIKELDLDYFVEDNWDIVNHLAKELQAAKKPTKVLWIYNLLDRRISYPLRFPSLKRAIEHIEKSMGTKKTNVLLVTDYFYPHWTGIAKAMLNLIKTLQDKLNFSVLTVQFDKKLKKEEIIEGATVLREEYAFSMSRVKYSVALLNKFLAIISRYDTVLVNSPNSNILPIAILTKLFRKRLTVFHQGDLILPKGIVNRLIEKIFDIATLLSFSMADGVSTYTRDYANHSRVLKPFLKKFTPLMIPMYVNTNVKLQASTAKTELLKVLKSEGKTIFGFAGRFVEEKGFDVLFDAIAILDTSLPDVVFSFAGENNMGYENFYEKNKGKLEKVKDKVINLGLLNGPDLDYFYNAIDFIVVASRSDCFPLVQAEAVICGKPTIVADIPGARHIVKQSGFGVIFEKENPQALAEAIKKALKNRESLVKHHQKALEIFDNERNGEAIRTYLEGGN